MAMNLKQTRIVDPVLTNVAVGYANAELVGNFIFPKVFVPQEGGKVIKFGKESFKLHNAKRALTADRKRISFGYEGEPFVLEENSLEASVDRRQLKAAETMPGLDLASRAVNITMNTLLLGAEYEIASLARDAANYDSDHKTTLSGTAKWSDGSSDPIADIAEAQKVIEESIGRSPNLLTLSNAAYRALKSHPAILEHFKHTSAKAVSVDDKIAAFEKLKNDGKAFSFILANGKHIGDFILDKIDKSITSTEADGTLIAVDLTLSLIECPEHEEISYIATGECSPRRPDITDEMPPEPSPTTEG